MSIFKKIRVIEGQTLLDLAIEQYGHLGGVFDIMEDNPQFSITDIPMPGSDIFIKSKIENTDQTATDLREYFDKRSIRISSGFKTDYTSTSSDLYVDEDYWEENYTNE